MVTIVRTDLADPWALLEFAETRLDFGVWAWDVEAQGLWWSMGLYRILGVDPRTIVPSFELYTTMVHPEDRLDFGNAAVAAGRLSERTFRIIRPTGELRWIRSYGTPVHDSDGRITRMIGCAMDVTEQRRVATGDAVTEGMLDAVRLLIDGWVWQTEADGTVKDGFEWWKSVGGIHPFATGWSREQFVHPDDRAMFRQAWDKAVVDRSPYRCSYRFADGVGGYVGVESSAMPVFAADGSLSGWVGITVPQTDQRTQEISASEISGPLIRAARNYYGWSIADLAEAAGLSFSTIRRIETDLKNSVGEAYLEKAIAALTARGASFRRDGAGRVSIVFAADDSEGS